MTVKQETLKIGTRGSKLALYQTNLVKSKLEEAHPDLNVEIVVIRTSGDWNKTDGEVPLAESDGGKALFAKEIEDALLSGHVDLGVHSAKDMDSVLPQGLSMTHFLTREDPRDVILFNNLALNSQKIHEYPKGLRVGTISVRRASFLLHHNSELDILPIRGNLETRLEKLENGQYDATILAAAGLNRLGLKNRLPHTVLSVEEMTPCAGQGAIGIEHRTEDSTIAKYLDAIACIQTSREIRTERSVLKGLQGSCHTPIGIFAKTINDTPSANATNDVSADTGKSTAINNAQIQLRIQINAPDGSDGITQTHTLEIPTGGNGDDTLFVQAERIGLDLKKIAPHEWV